jgi:hypothetical protein
MRLNNMLSEFEYNKIKEEAIKVLSKVHPNINVRNLIKEKWCFPLNMPFFYIEIEYDFKEVIKKSNEI